MKKIILIILLLLSGCNHSDNVIIDENKESNSNNKYVYLRENDKFTSDIVQGLMTRKRMSYSGIAILNYNILPHNDPYSLKADISINGEITTIDLLTIKANGENETLLYCSDIYILKVALTDDKDILEYSEYDVNALMGYPIYYTAAYPRRKDLYEKKDNKITIDKWEYHTTTKELFETHEFETDTLIIELYLEV